MNNTLRTALTVLLTQNDVTETLPSGRVLTLTIGGHGNDARYRFVGGHFGDFSISADASVTDDARLAAHWASYVEVNRDHAIEVAAAQKVVPAAPQKVWVSVPKTVGVRGSEMVKAAEALPKRLSLAGPGGIKVVLDSSEVYPEDPGNGCPAMVSVPFKGSGTYNCVADNGTVCSNWEEHELTRAQMNWLNSEPVASAVNIFVDGWFAKLS